MMLLPKQLQYELELLTKDDTKEVESNESRLIAKICHIINFHSEAKALVNQLIYFY